ncbi:MAG: phosphate ABC transporter permease subunit PstC [Spirochaetaceae bacterium]|nr:MAG: phosphate ABC transporter permease subunit PstC [Spirochaetaceae bacterium]
MSNSGKRQTRRLIDNSMRRIFRVISWFSVVALISMLVFVFVQGIEPFVRPTAHSIEIVIRNFDKIKINSVEYGEETRGVIPVSEDSEAIHIEFENKGELVDVRIPINDDATEAGMLSFPASLDDNISSQEDLTWVLSWAGRLPGVEKSVYITVPEPRHGILPFLFGTEWRPVHRKLYGIFPMIVATLLTTLGAIILGVPIALLSTVLISEFLSKKTAMLVQNSIDLLAGIPSVVYGFFGLMIVVPLVQSLFNSASGSSLISGVIVLGIMILPTVVAISLTSLKAVPVEYREASLALGATKMQTSWRVVFPAAGSGVFAAIILGVSRAIGETMAVIMVVGNSPQLPTALTDSVRTLTGTIALEMGYSAGRHNHMLFSIGIVLFIIIFLLNTVFMRLKSRMLARGM